MTLVDRSELVDALKVVAPAVPRHTGLPILSGVRIANGTLTATNLDLTISTALDVDLDVVVPHGVLTRIAGSMGAGAVSLDTDGDHLRIEQESTAAKIRTLVADEWPQLAGLPGDPHDLSATDVHSLGRIIHAVALDGAAYSWGPAVHVTDGAAEASDSYRLARIDLTPGLPEMLVPATVLRTVLAAASDGLTVCTDGNWASFATDDTTWSTRLLGGDAKYPNFGRLLDEPHECRLDVGAEEFVDALERLGALGPIDSNSAHRLDSDGDQLQLRRTLADVGEMSQSIDCAGTWAKEVKVPGPYMVDATHNAATPTVTIQTDERTSSLRIDGSSGYVAIVMPVAGPSA